MTKPPEPLSINTQSPLFEQLAARPKFNRQVGAMLLDRQDIAQAHLQRWIATGQNEQPARPNFSSGPQGLVQTVPLPPKKKRRW